MSSRAKSKPAVDSTPFNAEEATQLFNSLAEADDPEVIGMEGIGNLCDMLQIDPNTDVRILVLMWKLEAKAKPGSINREEFMKGMKKLNKSSVAGLASILPTLDPGFLERTEFRDFYRFVFQFSREGTHKTIEKDVVCALMPIVLSNDRTPHLPYFLEFLKSCSTNRITLDQWDSFLQFNHVVDVNLKNCEDDGAWPLLLDEYIEWRRKK